MTAHDHHPAGRPSLVPLSHRPGAALRLICLPPAGLVPGFYLPWAEHLPPTVDLYAVQLPGRGALADQPCLTDPHRAATALADLITRTPDDRPFALFGHSIGALLAYETTRTLNRTRRPMPVLLALSALPAPHLNAFTPALAPIMVGGQELVTNLVGPFPADVASDPGLLATAYTPLVADLLLALQYRHHREPPLELPLAVYGGREDPIAPAELLHPWNDLTLHPLTPQLFPGTHTYPAQQTSALTARLSKDLHTAARYTSRHT